MCVSLADGGCSENSCSRALQIKPSLNHQPHPYSLLSGFNVFHEVVLIYLNFDLDTEIRIHMWKLLYVCANVFQMGIRLLWVPRCCCSCFKTLTCDPHRRSPLTCHAKGSYWGSKSQFLRFISSEFWEGAVTWLSQWERSLIHERQGLPTTPPF